MQSEIKIKLDKDEANAVKVIKSNPKFFYSFAKRTTSNHSRVGPLINDTHDFTSDSAEMDDIFQKQFSSVFSDPNSVHKLTPDLEIPEKRVETFIVGTLAIEKAISEMKEDSSPGEDEFPAVILKKCKKHLSYPIFLI